MGSATTQALAASTQALAAATGVTLDTAAEFFSVARSIEEAPQLSGALADPAAPATARAALIATVFAHSSSVVREVLAVVVAQRWSNASDLIDGIEELAIRAASDSSETVDLEEELFEIARIIATNSELELALGGRFGDGSVRAALIEKVLDGKTSAAARLIVSSLVRQPRGRRTRQMLDRAMRIVSAQRNRVVATVHTAQLLTEAQSARLSDSLSRRYGAKVMLNQVIDPTVVGGLRVQIADDVIDGSISARLADLRQKLAG